MSVKTNKYFNARKGRQQQKTFYCKYVITKKSGWQNHKGSIIHPLCRFSRRWTPFDTSIEKCSSTYRMIQKAAQNGYQPIPFQSEKRWHDSWFH
jgi:hypothetical protein